MHCKETIVKRPQTAVVWSCLPFIRSGQNHLARHSEKGKKTRQTEKEVGRQHQGIDRPGVRQVPEGSGEQGRTERTDCKIICGAPTTLAVTGLMMMMMMMMMMMRVWRVQLGTAQLFWLAALRVFRTQPPTSAVIWSCNTLSRCLSVCTAQIDQHQVTYKRLLGFKTTGICRPVQHSPGNPSLPTQCKRMGLLLVCTEFTHHYFVYIHRDRSLLSAQAAKKHKCEILNTAFKSDSRVWTQY